MMKQFSVTLSLMWLSAKMVNKTVKGKLESTGNILCCNLGGDEGCFPALPERSVCVELPSCGR